MKPEDRALLEKLDELLEQKNSAISDLQFRLEHNNRVLERKDQIIHDQASTIEHLRQHINAYKNSFWWNATKPARVLSRAAKRAVKAMPGGKRVFSLLKRLRHGPSAAAPIEKHWHLSDDEKETQRNAAFNRVVKFSILVPLYNTPETYLKDLIASVAGQTYANWELCMADGSGPGHGYIAKICKKAAKKYKGKVKYEKLDTNLGISENTNRCIEMATGDYYALLDHDDALHPSALFENMAAICEGDADFIYSDECKFKEYEKDAFEFFHKPDFSPDTLMGCNYICHLTVFSAKLLGKVGGFRRRFDGSQDYDLILRLTEQAKAIAHIPKTLYFWRFCEGSATAGVDSKPYAYEAALSALEERLLRMGLRGSVQQVEANGFYKVNYSISGSPLISIIIPNMDNVRLLTKAISSILNKTSYQNYEIIIVENNSKNSETFDYYEKITKNSRVKLLTYDGAFNYSKINNFAVAEASGEYIVLLNNDTEIITQAWLDEMLMFAQRGDVGAVGAMLYYPDDTIQHAGVVLGMGGVAGHTHIGAERGSHGYFKNLLVARNLSCVTAACMMVPKDVYIETGGLNEGYAVAFNDIDFCMKIRRAGYLVIWTPFAELYHFESKSRGYEDTPEKQKRFHTEVLLFQKLWSSELASGDPYYNPNLSLETGAEYTQIEPPRIPAKPPKTDNDTHAAELTIAEKLNLYLDNSNYERAEMVAGHSRSLRSAGKYQEGLSIVILNLNKPELIAPLLDNLVTAGKRFKETGYSVEIIVGDTGSDDENVLNLYESLSGDIKVKRNMAYHFSKCNNELFGDFVSHDRVLFLNNDVVFGDAFDNIRQMLESNKGENVGITGAYLFYPDKRIQHMGIDFFKSGEAKGLCYHPNHRELVDAPRIGHAAKVPAVTGACLMIRSELFANIDGFDEAYAEECQDVALCLAAKRLGYDISIVYCGDIMHLENATRPKGSENWADRRRFLRKWKAFVETETM